MISTRLYNVIRKKLSPEFTFLSINYIILRKCFRNISDHVKWLARGHLSLD